MYRRVCRDRRFRQDFWWIFPWIDTACGVRLIWNMAIAIVAGADTAACASGRPWKSLDAIRGRFVAFAIAQFIGAGIFGGCIGLLLFPFHDGQIMVTLPMIIFPLALLRAGTDLASMSREFRAMKVEFKAWFCGCCYRR